MFEINWRITDAFTAIACMDSKDVDEATVEGFFQLNFNSRTYGYYHGNVLEEGEIGAELITFWFHLLLLSVIELNNSDYVALNDPESNTWIEFTVRNELVYVNFRKHIPLMGTSSPIVVSTPWDDFSPKTDVQDAVIALEELKNTLKTEVKKYVYALVNASSTFKDSRVLIKLLSMAREI